MNLVLSSVYTVTSRRLLKLIAMHDAERETEPLGNAQARCVMCMSEDARETCKGSATWEQVHMLQAPQWYIWHVIGHGVVSAWYDTYCLLAVVWHSQQGQYQTT